MKNEVRIFHSKMAKRVPVGIGIVIIDKDRLLIGCRKGSHGAGIYLHVVNIYLFFHFFIPNVKLIILGTWALPGGYLEYGEDFFEAGLREVEEETGIIRDKFKLDSVRMIPHIANNILRSNETGEVTTHTVSIFIEVQVKNDVKVEAKIVEVDKCSEWRWVHYSKDEIPSPMFPSLQSLLNSTYTLPTTTNVEKNCPVNHISEEKKCPIIHPKGNLSLSLSLSHTN